MQFSSQTLVRLRRRLVAALVAGASLLVPAIAQASTNYTWSGAAAPGTPNWSNGTNWEGSAPSGSVGTLTFPALTGAACVANPATATCYTSTNDVSGLNVNALSIDDGVPYNITGNAIILGAGGITASPSANDVGLHPVLSVPITLSAPQTWSINRVNGGLNEGLEVNANISGAVSDTLGINFGTSYAFFGITADAEVGAVTVTGSGALALGALASGAGGAVQGSLNGTNGNPVGLGSATFLVALDGATGPLTVGEVASLQVGEPGPAQGTSGTLAVNGGVTFNSTSNFFSFIHPGTVAGTNYSQLRASGAVSLNGATLRLSDGGGSACEVLTPGNVDTLITTTGLLTGTFHGVPDGTIISAECFAAGTAPTVKINYTAHAVTATVETAGSSGQRKATATALQASNANPSVGETVTYTATVTPEIPAAFQPIGSVTFLDNGSAIAACSAQPLTQGMSSSTATCQVSYAEAGSHSITATYGGSAYFVGSSSAAQTVTVHAPSTGGGSTGGGSAGSGGGGGTTTPPPPAPQTGTVTLSGAAITAQSNGRASVTLTCTGTATCSGTLTLTAKGAKRGKKKRPKTTTIGTAPFSIPAGKSATVALTLNAAGRALLRADHGRLNATLTILTSSPAPTRTQHVSVHLAQRNTKARRT